MIKYGFELEGFYREGVTLAIPPKNYPTDGFPGLVEVKTISSSGDALERAFSSLMMSALEYSDVDFKCPVATFDGKQRSELRRRWSDKSAWDIQNIYGRAPRLLGNKTIASFQINISNLLREAYRDDKGVQHVNQWGLFDMPRIIRALDEEFKKEIKDAGRQPGEYCVKDSMRLEYRSLPNSVCTFEPEAIRSLLKRIKTAVEG